MRIIISLGEIFTPNYVKALQAFKQLVDPDGSKKFDSRVFMARAVEKGYFNQFNMMNDSKSTEKSEGSSETKTAADQFRTTIKKLIAKLSISDDEFDKAWNAMVTYEHAAKRIQDLFSLAIDGHTIVVISNTNVIHEKFIVDVLNSDEFPYVGASFSAGMGFTINKVPEKEIDHDKNLVSLNVHTSCQCGISKVDLIEMLIPEKSETAKKSFYITGAKVEEIRKDDVAQIETYLGKQEVGILKLEKDASIQDAVIVKKSAVSEPV